MDSGPWTGNAHAEPAARPLRLAWLPPRGLLALSLANFVLKLLTLGLYNFWAKTEVRRRIWSAVRLDGEPLHYTGTGRELFTGFLMVFAIVLVPVTLASVAAVLLFGPQSTGLGLFQTGLYLLFFFLTGIAIWRAQRYRLSRTLWRGIRAGLSGSEKEYAWTYFWTGLLIPLTLGWIMPWRTTKLQGLMSNATLFGDRGFTFDARPGPLYPRFAVMWAGTAGVLVAGFMVAALPVFGNGWNTFKSPPEDPATAYRDLMIMIGTLYAVIIVAIFLYLILSAVYRAKVMNHFAAHTRFEGLAMTSTATGWGLIRLAIGNFLLGLTGWTVGAGLAFAALAAGYPIYAANPDGLAATGFVLLAIFLFLAASGLLAPIVQARNTRYVVDNLVLSGTINLDAIAQGEDPKLARGEGLAQAFEIDAI